MRTSHFLIAMVAVVLCGCGRRGDPVPSVPGTHADAAPHAAQSGEPAVVAAPDRLAARVVPAIEVGSARRSAPRGGHDHPAFDRAGYRADPAGYLARIAPGRVHEVADPAAGVALIAPVGPSGFSVETNAEAVLAARTEPGMPVTFTSTGLGEFPDSGFPSITVAADDAGIARARFRVTPGTVGSCQIIAGSPAVAGTTTFLVSIPESAP